MSPSLVSRDRFERRLQDIRLHLRKITLSMKLSTGATHGRGEEGVEGGRRGRREWKGGEGGGGNGRGEEGVEGGRRGRRGWKGGGGGGGEGAAVTMNTMKMFCKTR